MEPPVSSLSASPPDEMSGLFKQVMDHLLDGVYFTDRERRITYWNQAAESITGYSAAEVMGKRCADRFLMHVDDTGCVLCEGDCPLSRAMVDGCAQRADVYLHHKSGHRVPVEVRVCPIQSPDGEIVGAVEIFSDNSRQRAVRERAVQLAEWAFLDPTSQVGNRRYLEQQLSQQLDQLNNFGTPFGVMLIDVDKFKSINDTYGHVAGDAALLTVAKTLTGCLRASDTLGRWGGDEFLAILKGATQEGVKLASERCRSLVASSSVPVERSRIGLTISVGAALAAPADSVQSILNRADQQLYSSKHLGRNRASA